MKTVFASPHALGATAPGGLGGLASVTLALLIVLGAIFGIAWMARRLRGLGNRVGGALDLIASVPLGPKERAVLLRVGKEQILLGVAPGSVTRLHVLPEPLPLERAPATPADGRPSFGAILRKSLGK